MRNRLLNLYARNARKGVGLVAEGNAIYLYDHIAGSESEAQYWGGISAEGFAKQLNAMTGDVMVRIDSPGGDVFGGRAIAQAIREYDGLVTCQIDGLAASAASYIAIAGDKVVAAPGAFMMIHRAWTLSLGNCNDLRSTADLLEKIDGTIAASYAAKAGGDAATWLEAMTGETWYVAGEAMDLGLIDEVLPETVDKGAGAKGSDKGGRARVAWDVSAFEHAPAALVESVSVAPVEAEISAGLTARQAALYEQVESIAEELGPFDQTSGADGAHYMAASPFAGEGIKCANCSLFAGGRACEVVAGDIDPDGVCKLWIIKQELIGSPTNGATEYIAARGRRLAVALLQQPA